MMNADDSIEELRATLRASLQVDQDLRATAGTALIVPKRRGRVNRRSGECGISRASRRKPDIIQCSNI